MHSTKLLVNVTPNETRLALIEQGILKEVQIERHGKLGVVSNIYKGKVIRILPGMQSAFVDIGLDKAGFLHSGDIVGHSKIFGTKISPPNSEEISDINDLIYEGQEIIVQVIKDPIGSKGAKLTMDITLPSRYLVFMPKNSLVIVSQRVTNECERERLKEIVTPMCDELGGFIIRTNAEGATEEELRKDAEFLKRLWRKVLERKSRPQSPAQLYGELAPIQRILRDFIGKTFDSIYIDSEEILAEVKKFTHAFIPCLSQNLKLYTNNTPLFDLYNVEENIKQALQTRVNLKSGGYLVIEQTEAMTTIDVNTGAFVGHRNLAETIFNTNIEATSSIAQQLQLRNLGGMILVDFIDMQSEEHQQRVLDELNHALSQDRIRSTVHGFTRLGLVEITRKRTRESLEQLLCEPCPNCNGRGKIKSVETLCYEISREIIRINQQHNCRQFIVYASPIVADYLICEKSQGLISDLEVMLDKEILIKAENLYTQEQFDVIVS